tara:strand:- start:9441 stop:10139 length:699 start_codon:yes stop_codon:yes gene_type:complete
MARNLALHPGFPEIGAIDIFRANVQSQLNDAQRYFERELQAMSNENKYGLFGAGDFPRNQQNAFRVRQSDKDTLQFQAFFDKAGYRQINENINREVMEIGKRTLDYALEEARDETQRDVKNMRRNFKSRLHPNKEADGDLYETIADSLDYEETWGEKYGSSAGRFVSYIAGSRENMYMGELDTGGVKGRRMRSGDESLVELTESGTGPFEISKIGAYYRRIRENPAARMRGG